MRLVNESGLWATGPTVAAPPAVAVLELDGAVLAWTVDDPSGVASTHVTFTNVDAAEWLWRVVGQRGHVALLAALGGRSPDGAQAIDVPDVELSPAALAPLRRLAVGHWLRRWWPASSRDGIVGLNAPVLDGELALLTEATQDYFTGETLDSDVAELLRPHQTVFAQLVRDGDPRVAELATACMELADEVGGSHRLAPAPPAVDVSRRRDDYALAAGSDSSPIATGQIARGVGSVNWAAVPPGLFDAADRTVDWAIEVSGSTAVAAVQVAANGPVAGIRVRLRAGAFTGTGVLDAAGRTTLALVGASSEPMTETQAWDHDWPQATVTIGADVADSTGAAELRQRLRDFARDRLAHPAGDAFLAELLAAESDY
jgi:hypothetical protein